MIHISNMFRSRNLLLIPLILASGAELQINNYVVKFMSDFPNTIESIEVIGYPSEELNLSGLNIKNFTDKAFENVSHIRTLNLSNNSLTELRDTLFASLTNLQHLDLSHNNINEIIRKPFANLSNLKNLNLSTNNLTELMAGNFFGLTRSCVILLKENHIHTMSTELFENKSYPIDRPEMYDRPQPEPEVPPHFNQSIKICINATKLISVELFTEGEELASGCSTVEYREDNILSLISLGIAGFEKGWYKLGDLPIQHINLNSNNITRLTSEMLNDLPASVISVYLKRNQIAHLEKGIIVNEHLREMDFQSNFIMEIEDDVFINTNLTTLDLTYNKLKDTKFAATLPSTLTELNLDFNEITEISPESFSKLNKLKMLWLYSNNITVIHTDSLRGLSGLKTLSLEKNRIQKIEAGSFQNLTELENLKLRKNDFVTLDLDVFAGLKNIKSISLNYNKLWKLTRDTSIEFPNSPESLYLGHNHFDNLMAGAFVNYPKNSLFLDGNRIKNIENGSFLLPHLGVLCLDENLLSVINKGMFQGLKTLRYLDLSKNNITKIEKGAFENLGGLCQLFLSGNPITKLENGTLHGLLQEEGCSVDLESVPIEIIHGGVFAKSDD